MSRNGILLDSRSSGDEDSSHHWNEDRTVAGSTLAPADGGKDAWLFLAGSFVIETLTFGFSLAFGVLQEYYSTHEPFAESKNIATIGTTASVCNHSCSEGPANADSLLSGDHVPCTATLVHVTACPAFDTQDLTLYRTCHHMRRIRGKLVCDDDHPAHSPSRGVLFTWRGLYVCANDPVHG